MHDFLKFEETCKDDEITTLMRLLEPEHSITWADKTVIHGASANIYGSTNRVEARENFHVKIRENVQISSSPTHFNLEQRPTKTPILLNELKAYLDERFFLMESNSYDRLSLMDFNFKSKIVRLKSDIDSLVHHVCAIT